MQTWFEGMGPMTLTELLREKWGDVVAIFLIMLGAGIHVLGADAGGGHHIGDGLVAAGLAVLRLSMPARKNG